MLSRLALALVLPMCSVGVAEADADAGPSDAAPSDAGPADAGSADAGSADAGPGDAGPGDAPRSPPSSLITGAHETLFVGNSYVFTNEVSRHYGAIAAALGASEVRVATALASGYTLSRHASDMRTEGTPLAGAMRSGSAIERAFDVVILQEQSQIGGFPEGSTEREASLTAASELASLATANGSAVVLYATWGRERGDEAHAGLFPTFTAMQDRLDAGYLAMAARLRAEGARVRVAPVGAGFRRIHDAMLAAGEDPTAEGSAFDRLYEIDGAHPSIEGAYLAACILMSTVTGTDPLSYPDPTGLGTEGFLPSVWARLRAVASEVMHDPSWSAESWSAESWSAENWFAESWAAENWAAEIA